MFYWFKHKIKLFIYNKKYWIKVRKDVIKYAWDYRFECNTEFDSRPSTPKQFMYLIIKSLIKNNRCLDCNGSGRTGYYEPEDCSTCDGFGFNWKEELEPNWEEMAKFMEKDLFQS